MTCPKCCQQIPEGANFCPQCSTSLGPYSTGDAPLSDASVTAKRWRLGAFLGLVAALLMFGLFSFAKPLLQHLALNPSKMTDPTLEHTPLAPKPQPVPSIDRAESTPPVLRKIDDPTPPPPILHKIDDPAPSPEHTPPPKNRVSPPLKHRIVERPPPPAPVRRSAPPEAIAYLNALREIEAVRQGTIADYAGAISMYTLARSLRGLTDESEFRSGTDNLQEGYQAHLQQFLRLRGKWQQLQPPAPCLQLHNAYGALLQNYAGVIGRIQKALQSTDLVAAMALLTSAGSTLKGSLLVADGQLGAVCRHYNPPKSWQISE